MFATQTPTAGTAQGDQLPSLAQVMSGGTPSAIGKDDPIGTRAEGIVKTIEAQQQRDIDTGAPKFFDNGQPMMQIVVQIATERRDPTIPGDDGARSVYVKGKNIAALRSASRRAGRDMPHPGDRFAVTYSANGEAKKRGWNPPKLYTYELTPNAAQVAEAMNAPRPAAPAVNVQQIRQLAATGRTPEEIAGFLGVDPADVQTAIEPEF